MALKIKWNDDRIRGAMTAVLLIGRDRLQRGETADLIQASLADYRDDPAGYKASKVTWADAKDGGSITNPEHLAYYKNLLSAMDRLVLKVAKQRIQFNSLLELDNWLIANLKKVR